VKFSVLPAVHRPGICYHCRQRPGTVHLRGLWACRRCLLSRDVKDAFLIVLMVVCMATIVAMVFKRTGYCRDCPDVPMPVLHVISEWTH
jgi:hypothetical protein